MGGGGAAQLGGPDQRDQPRAGTRATLPPDAGGPVVGRVARQAGLGPEQLGPVDSAQSLCVPKGSRVLPPPASCGRAGRPGAIAWPEGSLHCPPRPAGRRQASSQAFA